MFETEEKDMELQTDTEMIETEPQAEAEMVEAEPQAEAEMVEAEPQAEAEAETQESGEMETGTVKWFSNPKGYGFIARDAGDDIFVHYSSITGGGFRSLNEGARVEFSIEDSPKGPRAANVKPLESDSGWL